MVPFLLIQMANIERATVHLAADNPTKFEKLVAPDNGCGFGDVCTFVAALADAGIEVSVKVDFAQNVSNCYTNE